MRTAFVVGAFACLGTSAFADVRGLYGSECLQMNDLSATKDIVFDSDAGRLEIVQTVYADKVCSLPAYDFSFSGPYTYHADEGSLDYRFESIQLRVLESRVALAFMDVSLCGEKEWIVDVPHEVTGVNCAGTVMPSPGLELFDLLKESPDGIQLGQASEEKDGLSPEGRPQAFDPNVFTAR